MSAKTKARPYVTVMPSGRRHGYMVAHRDGDVITHRHIGSGTLDEIRAEAARMFPKHVVYLAGDPVKPWEA